MTDLARLLAAVRKPRSASGQLDAALLALGGDEARVGAALWEGLRAGSFAPVDEVFWRIMAQGGAPAAADVLALLRALAAAGSPAGCVPLPIEGWDDALEGGAGPGRLNLTSFLWFWAESSPHFLQVH